ncbi:hypothetical protein [Chryseobacterium bernardetii]|uniref:hypothetical protein n=1 Tax=Chryseobacterium bernardetii TaxID=1241978 RepID=UPI00162A6D71|nr:hypothetical protein [Chryseobacterium bernardetii]
MISYFGTTQFYNSGLREFVRSRAIDQLDTNIPYYDDGIRRIVLITSRYIVDNYNSQDRGYNYFKYSIENNTTDLTTRFPYYIIPKTRFGRSSEPNLIIENDETKLFLKALAELYNSNRKEYYLGIKNARYSSAYVDALLNEFYPIFNNSFNPVFQIDVYNNGEESLLIKDLSVIVEDFKEYAGGTEEIKESDVFNIIIEKKIGEYFVLNKPSILIKSGEYQRLFIRLSSNTNECSYKLRFKIHTTSISLETETILTDL